MVLTNQGFSDYSRWAEVFGYTQVKIHENIQSIMLDIGLFTVYKQIVV